ncbi:MAG: DoxX family protein [Actinomycetota bacterium]
MQPQTQTEAFIAGDLQVEGPVSAQPDPVWSFPLRLGFRFGFIYLILYGFPGPLAFIPGVNLLFGWYEKAWKALVIWTGAHVLHLSHPVQYIFTGSGDTMHDYIQNGLTLVVALAGIAVWSVLDRRRPNYSYLYQWLRFYVRLYLGATLLSYGAYKVIKSQFAYPYLTHLLEPYGNSSPMGLLWTFMGYSTPYTIFAGAVEMLGGALLILPRLTTLGALVSAAAMTNVFLLNMSYDVPVKIFSLNLLLMSCFLLLPELGRLTNVFILNRATEPMVPPPLFRRRWLVAGLVAAQLLFLAWCSGYDLYHSFQQSKQYGDLAPRPPLYGIYSVDELTVDGQLRPPLLTDATRWRYVTFDVYNVISLVPPDGPVQRFRGKLDDKAGTLELSKPSDKKWKADFKLEHQPRDIMLLSGTMDGKAITARLRKLDYNSFLLNSRGFHWISELPFNR